MKNQIHQVFLFKFSKFFAETLNMSFWQNVSILLEKEKSSFRCIANLLSVNESTISTMRSRNVSPRAEEAYKIAQALNTTVEYLVTGKSPEMADKYDKLKTEITKILNNH